MIKHELQLDNNWFSAKCFDNSSDLIIRIGTEEGGVNTSLDHEQTRELLVFLKEFVVRKDHKVIEEGDRNKDA